MWGKFVAEFRAAPIPSEWKKNGPHPVIPDLTYEEIRGNYYAALDEASEPQKQAAKGAFKECLDLSVRFQYFDEFSRACEVWLAKNYKAEYHVVDELRGAPTLANSGLDEKAPPVLPDGTFWHPAAAAPEKTVVSSEETAGTAKAGGAAPAGGGAAKPRGAQAKPLPGGKKK